jgi:hypothetical protein
MSDKDIPTCYKCKRTNAITPLERPPRDIHDTPWQCKDTTSCQTTVLRYQHEMVKEISAIKVTIPTSCNGGGCPTASTCIVSRFKSQECRTRLRKQGIVFDDDIRAMVEI